MTSVLALALLGAGHGINPGMGWLFAVALGLQEGRSRAVWRALPPLAAGHALAIGAALVAALALGRLLPAEALRWIVAALLIGVGIRRLIRHRHPRWAGMRVGFRDLTLWSFLMASAHGAGLMVVPLVLAGAEQGGDAHAHHVGHLQAGMLHAPASADAAIAATLVHTVGYLLVTGLLAVVVYRKLGLRLLRAAWINLDLVWAGVLVVTGIAVPLL